MELSIGQNVNLTQAAPEVHNILVGLRWRTDEPLLRECLEAGVLLTTGGRLVNRRDFVFAHQVLDSSASVHRRAAAHLRQGRTEHGGSRGRINDAGPYAAGTVKPY